jgi:hypothetical protein
MAPGEARDPRINRQAREMEDEDGDMPHRRVSVPATGGVIRVDSSDGINSTEGNSGTDTSIGWEPSAFSGTFSARIESTAGVDSSAGGGVDSSAGGASAPAVGNSFAPAVGRSFATAFQSNPSQDEHYFYDRNVRARADLQTQVFARATERGAQAASTKAKWKQSDINLNDVTEIQALISTAALEQVTDIPNVAKLYDWLEEANVDKWQQLVRSEIRGDPRVIGDCLDFIEILLARQSEMHTKVVENLNSKASSAMSIEGMYDLLVVTYNKFVERKKALKVLFCQTERARPLTLQFVFQCAWNLIFLDFVFAGGVRVRAGEDQEHGRNG